MPPRIRKRASKAMKENMDTENKLKTSKNNTKTFRKALADKTNSASDETFVEARKKMKRVVNKMSTTQTKQISGIKSDELPRRNRRVPQRFQNDTGYTNISKTTSHNNTTVDSPKPNNNLNTSSRKETPANNSELGVSPFKTPSKLETSLVVNRPRRICRLPSRFDDHFVSPNKIIPLKPTNASTPIQPNKIKTLNTADSIGKKGTQISKPTLLVKSLKKKPKDISSADTASSDTNNNANARSTRANITPPKPLAPKKPSPKVKTSQIFVNKSSAQVLVAKKNNHRAQNSRKIKENSLSFQVLGGKKKSQESESKDLNVYEFTFDPTEEPQPQKKKRKEPAIKKPKAPKPKTTSVTYKSTYDRNISKALSALKKTVQTKKNICTNKLAQIEEISDEVAESNEHNNIATKTTNISSKDNYVVTMNDKGETSVYEGNYPSIRIEDIAADIEPSLDHHTDLNYSPVNSPRPQSPSVNPALDLKQNPERFRNIDPLNLQEDLSFFDDIPVASSSMNISVRHPLASPWRVEFGSLPIKWHSNAYVKPNMTPAIESSFICTEDSNRKKHVYTNMVPEANESLPQIIETPALKQSSIISFIKEVAERQAKKKRGRSVSPSKALVEFNNIDAEGNMSFRTLTEKVADNPASEEVSISDIETSNETENSKENRKTRKRKNNENICVRPAKSPRRKDKDCTYFGFNDSEDQENESPPTIKINSRGKCLRPRTRPVLQEINGPTRADLPIAVKSKTATSSEAVNKVYGELKSAADAPVFPENVDNTFTNIEDLSTDDSQSVHLFEDIDVVHHLKPTRKSYSKAKKVTFHHPDGEYTEGIIQNDQSSYEDDLGDLTFDILNVKEKKKAKKKRPKKLMSKKEEKEAEEWAAGFNSMCEEVEEFPLMVE